MDIYCEHHSGQLQGPELNIDKIYKKNNTQNYSPFFQNSLSDMYATNAMQFFLHKNRQFHSLAQNLSLDFILRPRKPFLIDILIANENLDRTLAGLIYTNNNIKNLTIFRDEVFSFSDLLSSIKKLRTHSRSDTFKYGNEFTLNPINRQRFYLLNKNEYILWQSAIWCGSRLLSSIKA